MREDSGRNQTQQWAPQPQATQQVQRQQLQTQLSSDNDQVFNINGIRSAIRVELDNVCWWPVEAERPTKVSPDSATKKFRQHRRLQNHQRLDLLRILNVKLVPNRSKRISRSKYSSPNKQTDDDSDNNTIKQKESDIATETTPTVTNENKLIIFYAEPNEHKSVHKLLKLKELTITSLIHDRRVIKQKQTNINETDESNYDNSALHKLYKKLQNSLEVCRQVRPKRLLIFVNPYGGKGNAIKVYKRRVKPLLEIADIERKLIVTKYANHARETIEDPLFNVEYYDGVICVGGDGMFSELMNGLLFRYNRSKILSAELQKLECSTTTTNSDHSIDLSSKVISDWSKLLGGIGQPFVTPPISLGVIGAGSTDANSFGFYGTNDVTTSTLNILLGNQIHIDVCSVHSLESDRLLKFVSTFVAYGYFGDIIRESERLRWLGPSRYEVTALNILLKMRTYKGTVRLLVSDEDGTPHDSDVWCHNNCQLCQMNTGSMSMSAASSMISSVENDLMAQQQQQQQFQSTISKANTNQATIVDESGLGSNESIVGASGGGSDKSISGCLDQQQEPLKQSIENKQRQDCDCERDTDEARIIKQQSADAYCNRTLSMIDQHQTPPQQQHDGTDKKDLSKFRLIECKGAFTGVNAAVTACRCPQTWKGFSPGNHLANGCADLILVKPCSRVQYINYLLRTGVSKKSAFDLKYVDAFRCRQFEFILADCTNKISHESSDRKLSSLSSSIESERSVKSSNSNMTSSSQSNGLDTRQWTCTMVSTVSSTGSSSSTSGAIVDSSTAAAKTSASELNSTNDLSKPESLCSRRQRTYYSCWNMDGEVLEEQSIRVKVNKQLLSVFGTGEPQRASC